MAGSFFALFDDIASLMDDIAAISKTSFTKSVGVTGDDLAVSTGQISGVISSRELPVIWKITKGSLKNKLGLILVLLVISAFAPAVIPVLLVLGAGYLSYEGSEKLFEMLHTQDGDVPLSPHIVLSEEMRIKIALRTDVVLSAEIMVIALSTVLQYPLLQKFMALCVVGLGVTVVVYGLVAVIIRLDDMGFALQRSSKPYLHQFGNWLVTIAPKIMHLLGFIGMIAMLMVAGGMFNHIVGPHWEGPHIIFKTMVEVVYAAVVGGALLLIHHVASSVVNIVSNKRTK